MSFFRQPPGLPPGSNPRIALQQQRGATPAGEQRAGSASAAEAGLPDNKELQDTYMKISRVLVPTFMLVVILNQIDRNNLAFAALTMNRDLGFDAQTYGLGSALFFLTFCLFQVPSNLVMVRVGVRRWLPALIMGWGVVASCCALIHNATSFFVLRLLLGAFESGATPAMWFALSQFFPQERMTKPYMYLTMGVLLANVFGAPLAAGFLAMDGIAGLRGWQWLFMLEGIPSILMGLVLLLTLPDTPADAKWLTEEQKALLAADMADSAKRSPPRESIPRNPLRLLRMVLANPLIPLISLSGFIVSMAAFTYIFWLPVIINALLNGTALSNAVASAKRGSFDLLPVLLTIIPYFVAAFAAWGVAHSAQRRDELYFHSSTCLLLGGLFFLLFPFMAAASIPAGFVSLVLTSALVASGNGPSHGIAGRISSGPAQVIGMPFFSSVSVIGGFVGPFVTGAIVQQRGGFQLVCMLNGGLLMFTGVIILALRWLVPLRERHMLERGDCPWLECDDGLPTSRKDSGPDLPRPGGGGSGDDSGVQLVAKRSGAAGASS